MTRPYVLITNDDGIASPGLKALAEAVQPFCDILIVAPRDQQTNMGRGTLKGPEVGSIKKHIMTVNSQWVTAWSVNGSPAQAVAHGVLELAERKPDFCFSGINYGENLGLAFTCSGTLGACFEADSIGIPSIAFSRKIPMDHQRSDEFGVLSWDTIKDHIRKICLNVIEKGMSDGVRLLNVNFPDAVKRDTEVRITSQAYMNYGAYVHPGERAFDEGHQLGWCRNDGLHKADEKSDIYAIHQDGVISVTPLQSVMSVDAKQYYN